MGAFKHEVTERIRLAKQLRAEGLSLQAIAKKFDVCWQCIQADLRRAEQRGKHRTPEEIAALQVQVCSLHKEGKLLAEIAKELGISTSYATKLYRGERGELR